MRFQFRLVRGINTRSVSTVLVEVPLDVLLVTCKHEVV